MASAAMIHIGLDPGKLLRWLGGEYTGKRRNVNHTLTAVRDHISTKDFNHVKRILLDGSPYKLTFEEPLANKSAMLQRGNSKSFNENPELVSKTLNKEYRYVISWLISVIVNARSQLDQAIRDKSKSS